jgi:preprotein translocase SecE subunit
MALEIYKKGQAGYTRLGSAIGFALLVAIGCYKLYEKFRDFTWIANKNTRLYIATMVPSAVFVGLGILIFWLINKPTVSDFLISSEGEIKKVNWSTRQEIAVSTFIVIVVVTVVSVLLCFTDLLFGWFFTQIL